jgi:hypothetical protein
MPYSIRDNENIHTSHYFKFVWACDVDGCVHHGPSKTEEGAVSAAARHAVTHTDEELAATGYKPRWA